MNVAQLTANGFDILNVAETNTSLTRNENMVRLAWKDEENRLIQLVKQTSSTPGIGTLLRAHESTLMPTGDMQSTVTVAKLLAPMTPNDETKQITIDGVTYTAHLLPVQIV